jgi:bacillolysin
MSDVFGEFVDQTYKLPDTKDGPEYDWLVAEDTAEWAPMRSMADPTRELGRDGYRSPDRMHPPLYFEPEYVTGTASSDDSGGVHYNSGVGNEAAYLITAPGTHKFNGQSITGVGIGEGGAAVLPGTATAALRCHIRRLGKRAHGSLRPTVGRLHRWHHPRRL